MRMHRLVYRALENARSTALDETNEEEGKHAASGMAHYPGAIPPATSGLDSR